MLLKTKLFGSSILKLSIKIPIFFKNRSDPEDTKHQTSPVQTSDNVSTDSGISTDSGDFPESEQDTELFYEKPKHLNQ